MKGSFQIARIFDIPLQVHWSFALLLLGGMYFGYTQSWDLPQTMWAVSLVLALFTCVVLHEFGHALTARRYGVQTKDIILSPIGGVARLDRLPDHPRQEFMVAIAGPAVNILLSILLAPYLLFREATRLQVFSFFDRNANVFFLDLTPVDEFLIALFIVNVILALFNLLPAFPMDGGRILRAILSLRLGRTRATRIAAYLGQALAVGFVVYGFWYWSPVTAFIGIFVFLTASNENRMVQLEDRLQQHTVGEIHRQLFTKIFYYDLMERPVEQLTLGMERNFLVFDERQNVVGSLGEQQLMAAIREKDFGAPVAAYMYREHDALLSEDTVKTALSRLQENEYEILPVFESGALVGVVDLPAINTFLQLQQNTQ